MPITTAELPKEIRIGKKEYILQYMKDLNLKAHFDKEGLFYEDPEGPIHCLYYASEEDAFLEGFHIDAHGFDYSQVCRELKTKLHAVHHT